MPRHYKRKISAILSADVAGYGRLMGDDEDATVRTLTGYRNVISDLVRQHHGRVIDSPGDNLLAEFSSVVDALRCGWDVQMEIDTRNSELRENRRMNYRIGINLGDVIEEDGRIYGDGVNVAARLESLAEAGGINISGSAYDQVKNKLSYRFEYQGEQPVKNIKDPVRIYRVEMTPEAAGKRRHTKKADAKQPVFVKILLLVAAVAILSAGLAVWLFLHTRSLSRSHITDAPGHQLADKASIAVLPFKNLSENREQEYFSDGITNDIITDLSRFRYLLVISGNTTFTYKGKSVSAVAVGRELNVRYVLEGSVQKAGDTVRINAQLIDTSTGAHVWAERYERDYEDIFKLQGDLVQAIVARLAIKTLEFEQARAMRKKPQDLKAYDYLLRGWAHYNRRTRVSNTKAGEMFSKAVTIDPHYSAAYAGLGWVDNAKAAYGWTEFPDKALANAYALGRKALDLDESNANAHSLLANVYAFQNQYELAIREAERAIELNPNDSYSYAELGFVLLWSGRVDEAISALENSLRLDTNSPQNPWWHLGMAYYLKGRYKEALNILEEGVIIRPDFVGYHITLAATYARLGRLEEAARAADTVRRLDPFFQIDTYGTAFRNPTHRDIIVEGLRKAGLK
jgi:adenylate cyclase